MNKILCGSLSLLLGASLQVQAIELSNDVASRINEPGTSRVIITFNDKTSRSRLSNKGSQAEMKRTLKANYTASSREVRSLFTNTRSSIGRISDELWAANAMIAEVSNSALETLQNLDGVAQVTLDRVIPFEELPANSSDTVKEDEWTYGLKVLGVDKVRAAYNLTGKGVRVGILDTGIDANHPDLKGKVVAWGDFAGTSATEKDAHGHGTHCAGTIAGGSASGKHIGVAPEAELVIGRIFGDSGGATLAGILKAMNWMTDPDGNADTNDHPRLVSNSWGGSQGSMDKEQAMWNIVTAWRELNIVPVFAAGNSGPRPKTIGTPGGYPHSFAVGATDSNDKIAGFSSRGPITWEGKDYVKPEVSAPGVNIYSAKPGGGYQSMSGTSMACPHVSGLVALMIEANPALTVSEVESILKETSVDLGEAGPDNIFGVGRADIGAAIAKIKGEKAAQKANFESIFE